MLTTLQIIVRLFLAFVFGLAIGVFIKEKKSSDFRLYPTFSLVSAFISLFSLEIFLKIYSKVEIMLLPAILVLGLFLIAKALVRKGDNPNEVMLNTVYLLLVIIVGSSLGWGLYRLAIFATFLFLIFVTFVSPLEGFIQKIWRRR